VVALSPFGESFYGWFGAAHLTRLLKSGKLRGVARPSEELGHLVIPTDNWFLDVTSLVRHLLAVEGHTIATLGTLLFVGFLQGLSLLSRQLTRQST
jgi:hypothetical protein